MKELLPGWLHRPAPEGDVVVSSRIRLARNLQGYSFPHQADEQALESVIAKVERALKKSAFTLKRLDGIGQSDRLLLVEQYLISPDLLKNPAHRGVMVNSDQTVAIMLNEEDHIRSKASILD